MHPNGEHCLDDEVDEVSLRVPERNTPSIMLQRTVNACVELQQAHMYEGEEYNAPLRAHLCCFAQITNTPVSQRRLEEWRVVSVHA